ncbi:hypothetical protein I3843_11G181300 [Carya illinoinensis]|nr:hypothetical protein I3843_11G181300 [Carya illinoinensis]
MAQEVYLFESTLSLCLTVLVSLLCFTPSDSAGFSLKLIPRFSPESPLYPGNISQSERIQKLAEISHARANYLMSKSSQNATVDPENIHLPVHEDSIVYSAEPSLGTPQSSQFFLVDGASGLIWTQCLPCINCFNQIPPLFNSIASTTYQKIQCNDPRCRKPFYKCVNEKCVYTQKYGETFTFPQNNGRVLPVKDMIFGCSNDNQYFTFRGKKISGILGLNREPESLVSQLKTTIQGRFSYCLVYGDREMEATSILRFGEDTISTRRDYKTTPLMYQTMKSNYYLHLLDISVGDRRIGFPPGTFALKPNGNGGCIIDTGAITTFLDRGPYERVMKEFDEHFKSLGVQRVPKVGGMEYCYKSNPKFRAYIPMTFHFQGADYKVEPTYMYFHDKAKIYFCVALMPFAGKTVLGAWQQQDMRVVYDLNLGVVRFAPENCARDKF